MRVLYITNIPAPYKIDFFNELGKKLDLTVVFEAKGASNHGIKFNYNLETIQTFKAVFLSEDDIKEKTVDWKIIKYLKEPYDKIVIGAYSYFTEMFALLWLKARKKPYYLSTDGGMIKADENPIKKWYKTLLISGAVGYFSPSKVSDEYLCYYGAAKEKVHRYPFTSTKRQKLLNTTLSTQEKNIEKKKIGINEKKLILGIGQFIPRKGWDVLLRVMKEIPDDVALCLVGGNPIEEYNKIVTQENLKHIYFRDFMKNDELEHYYKAADIFVLPTREDIWGLVINEAMGYGLPIISTDQCVTALELVKEGENGFILPVNSDEKLRDKILLLLSDKQLAYEFSIESNKTISEYTIENMAENYAEILVM